MICTSTKISKEFLLAGDAIVTVANPSGEHYTYRIQKVEASERYAEAFFVKLLTGPDNTRDYNYLGKLDPTFAEVRLTAKSCVGEDAVSYRVIRWIVKLLWAGKELPEGYTLNHEGYCLRCSRLLTTPESVERGIGPECWKLLNF